LRVGTSGVRGRPGGGAETSPRWTWRAALSVSRCTVRRRQRELAEARASYRYLVSGSALPPRAPLGARDSLLVMLTSEPLVDAQLTGGFVAEYWCAPSGSLGCMDNAAPNFSQAATHTVTLNASLLAEFNAARIRGTFGFCTKDYRPACVMFEPIDMLRKLALSGLLQFVRRGTAFQVFCGCVLSFGSCCL